MLERTLVAALTMGLVGFFAFQWMLAAGWSEASARNALLTLMVLFENVHIFNCRSETRSAFATSPLKSPILLAGMLLAFSIHVVFMHLPLGQQVLGTGPMPLATWGVLLALALSILLVMELHKISWRVRCDRRR